MAAKKLNVPVIVKCGNSGPRFDLNMLAKTVPCGRIMAGYIAKNTTLFAAINREVGSQLKSWGVEKERIVFIPNGVSVPAINTVEEKVRLRKRFNLLEEDFVISGVGSLTPKKDFLTLLSALSRCHKEFSFTLILLGDGPLASKLKDQAKLLGIDQQVEFIGKVTHHKR